MSERVFGAASLLLIAIIRYVDAQIICIPEQLLLSEGEDDVIMMVISTLPGARRCLTAYTCMCARACARGR